MKKTLGIMSSSTASKERFLPYIKNAICEGFEEVFIFTPEKVQLKRIKIDGYVYKDGKWSQSVRSFPDMIYDLGYYRKNKLFRKAEEVKSNSNIPFIGEWLGNKWVVHRALLSSPNLSQFVIDTQLLVEPEDGLSMLKRFGSVILKPINGDSGKGIMRFSDKGSAIFVEKDGFPKTELSDPSVFKLFKSLSSKGYIVQRWLDLLDRKGRMWDCRSLVQKNKEGNWTLTGLVVRVGTDNHITTNLENGGKSVDALPVLIEQFGQVEGNNLYRNLAKVSYEIADYLEHCFDNRYAEFGIDLAIEKTGKIKVLEINHKPGKGIMKVKDNEDMYSQSVSLPMQYAAFLVKKGTRVSEKELRLNIEMRGRSREDIISRLIDEGFKYYGTPYRFGAKPWSEDAFDCSTFMQRIHAAVGIPLPRTSRQQSKLGTDIPADQMEKGDILFFSVESRLKKLGIERIGHVGLYCGNNKFHHACSLEGVTLTDLSHRRWGKLFLKAKRYSYDEPPLFSNVSSRR